MIRVLTSVYRSEPLWSCDSNPRAVVRLTPTHIGSARNPSPQAFGPDAWQPPWPGSSRPPLLLSAKRVAARRSVSSQYKWLGCGLHPLPIRNGLGRRRCDSELPLSPKQKCQSRIRHCSEPPSCGSVICPSHNLKRILLMPGPGPPDYCCSMTADSESSGQPPPVAGSDGQDVLRWGLQ